MGVVELSRKYFLRYCLEKVVAIALHGVNVIAKDVHRWNFMRASYLSDGVAFNDQREEGCNVVPLRDKT